MQRNLRRTVSPPFRPAVRLRANSKSGCGTRHRNSVNERTSEEMASSPIVVLDDTPERGRRMEGDLTPSPRHSSSTDEVLFVEDKKGGTARLNSVMSHVIEVSSGPSSDEDEEGRKMWSAENISAVRSLRPKASVAQAKSALRCTGGDIRMAVFKLESASAVRALGSRFKKRARGEQDSAERQNSQPLAGPKEIGRATDEGQVLPALTERAFHPENGFHSRSPSQVRSDDGKLQKRESEESRQRKSRAREAKQKEWVAAKVQPEQLKSQEMERQVAMKLAGNRIGGKEYRRQLQVACSSELTRRSWKWGKAIVERFTQHWPEPENVIIGETRMENAWEFRDMVPIQTDSEKHAVGPNSLIPYVFVFYSAETYVNMVASGTIGNFSDTILERYPQFIVEIIIPGLSSYCNGNTDRSSDGVAVMAFEAVQESLVWLMVEYGFRHLLVPVGEDSVATILFSKVDALARAPFNQEVDCFQKAMTGTQTRKLKRGAAEDAQMSKLSQIYLNWLTRIPGLTVGKAQAITTAFPSLRLLLDAFVEAGPERGRSLLCNLTMPTGMRLGPKLAEKVYNVLCNDQPGSLIR